MKLRNSVLSLLALCLSLGWMVTNVWAVMPASDIISALRPPEKHQAPPLSRGPGGIAKLHETVEIPAEQSEPQVALQFQFALNSATLQPEAIRQLREVTKALQDNTLNNFKFSIEGHTCDLGSPANNLELSKRRAYAVADFLTSYTNLSPEQFAVEWYGESVPAVENIDESARRINRRVVIKNTLEEVDMTLQGRPATLQIIRHRNGQQEIVSDGDTLTSNSNYSISFHTDKKQYAYVCQKDSSGKVVLLFPNSKYLTQGNPVAPATTYRIPGKDGQGFYLDETIGTEELALLALDVPVQEPLNTCATVFLGDTALQRGIGGISGIKSPSNNQPVAASENGIQLCEVIRGGRTRGIAGISASGEPTSSSMGNASLEEDSCQGFFLKRYFTHE